jgi:hypothetical protein
MVTPFLALGSALNKTLLAQRLQMMREQSEIQPKSDIQLSYGLGAIQEQNQNRPARWIGYCLQTSGTILTGKPGLWVHEASSRLKRYSVEYRFMI